MEDLVDGAVRGWPASLLIERDAGGRAYGANCAPYASEAGEEPPPEVQDACEDITEACYGLSPARALKKAARLGFVPGA